MKITELLQNRPPAKMPTDEEIELVLDEDQMFRADGDCICPICKKPYKEHRNPKGKYYWITVLCNGWLVKL